MTPLMKSLQVLSARDAALLIMRVITIGGALANLKMMKKYHFRKGVRSGLLVRIIDQHRHWLFSVCSSNGVACANL